jgi:signal transduction histidine kinase
MVLPLKNGVVGLGECQSNFSKIGLFNAMKCHETQIKCISFATVLKEIQRIPVASIYKLLLAFFMACVGVTAFANDHITSRSYWQDETELATLEQAQSQRYKAFEGVLSRGYTNSPIWIRLTITPPKDADKLVLRIRPMYLDEVVLFDPLDMTGKERKVGDTTSYRDNEYKSLAHTFEIPSGQQPRDIWLRLKSTSTTLISIEAFTPDEMHDSEFDLQLSSFAMLAVVAMFMLLVLISWINHRESLYALFVVRQVYYFFYTASLFGIHRYVLSDVMSASNLDLLYSWIVIGATALSFGFEYKFLSEYSPPKWARAVLKGLLIWSVCLVLLMLSGHVHQALKFNMLLNTVGVVTLFLLSAAFIDDKKSQTNPTQSRLPKKVVVCYYLSINLVLIFSLMPYLGVMKGNEFAVNGLVFYTLCSGLVMTVLMQLRASQIRKAQSEFEQELLISKKQVELEKSRREEQTHLFHMLMHELKNPLAIIDMALLAKNDLEKTSAYVNRAVGNMKAILDRCVKADKLTEGNVDVHKVSVNVNKFLRDLIDTDGHSDARVTLEVEGILTLNTDEQFFDAMCRNLVDNAVRYGDHMMPVMVQAQSKSNAEGIAGVSITVSNRPSSASWPDADKVFKKYYRSAGAEAQSGTGLGLYLVRTLARLVAGDCVYVPDEKNIRFELWLPS